MPQALYVWEGQEVGREQTGTINRDITYGRRRVNSELPLTDSNRIKLEMERQ